jgi:murein DD-endopeptidase MepM/ murein hydrolase activator NlpD
MRNFMSPFKKGKYVNFLIFPDQGEGIRFKISKVFAILFLGVSGALLLTVLLFITSLGEISYKALLAESLLKENERLRSYNGKVSEMEKELKEYRDLTSKIAQLAGIESVSLDRSSRWKTGMVLADGPLAPVQTEKPFLSANEGEESWQGTNNIPHGLALDGWISREFIEDPKSLGGAHSGIDLAASEGREVRATASGVVKFAGWDDYYGNLIVIDHKNGCETYYGHNSKLRVSKDETVKRGQVIALSGNTGRSTAPHLHYEIRKDGVAVNPKSYLGER